MKLSAWLEQQKIRDADFAREIKVSRQAIGRYKAGDRVPKHPIMLRIQKATADAVRPQDFFEVAA